MAMKFPSPIRIPMEYENSQDFKTPGEIWSDFKFEGGYS